MRAPLLIASVLAALLALPPQPLGSAVLERRDGPGRAVRVDHDGLFRYEPGPAVFPEGGMYVLCLPGGGCVRGERLRRKVRPAVAGVQAPPAPVARGGATAPHGPAGRGPQAATAGAAASPAAVPEAAGERLTGPQPTARTEEPAPAAAPDAACRAAIYFDKNRWEMGPAQRAQADRFVRCLGDCSRTEASVTGFTCDLGPAGWNRELAGRRAASVAGYLEKKGLKIAGIEARPQAGYLAKDRRFNRRVEIESVYR